MLSQLSYMPVSRLSKKAILLTVTINVVKQKELKKFTKSFQESGLIQRGTMLHFFGYFKLDIVLFKESVVFFQNQGMG